MRFLMERDEPDQVMLMLVDQPFVDATLLDRLISEKEKSGKGIVASKYSETLGVPVIFDKTYVEELLSLNGAEGAKKVIFENLHDTFAVDFPLGVEDLDTEEDLVRLKNWKI